MAWVSWVRLGLDSRSVSTQAAPHTQLTDRDLESRPRRTQLTHPAWVWTQGGLPGCVGQPGSWTQGRLAGCVGQPGSGLKVGYLGVWGSLGLDSRWVSWVRLGLDSRSRSVSWVCGVESRPRLPPHTQLTDLESRPRLPHTPS